MPLEREERDIIGSPAQIAGPADDFTPHYLDARRIRLSRSPLGSPRMEIEGEVCYPRIVVRRIRPLRDPDHWISFWADEDTEVGILKDPSSLDEESRRILREELDKRYFTPIITRIYKVKERFGVHDWDVETTRGRIRFSVRGLHQNVKQVPPARLLITDVQNNRYDIPDVTRLDPRSRELIQRHL